MSKEGTNFKLPHCGVTVPHHIIRKTDYHSIDAIHCILLLDSTPPPLGAKHPAGHIPTNLPDSKCGTKFLKKRDVYSKTKTRHYQI